jgi:serine/threonine protein kinase
MDQLIGKVLHDCYQIQSLLGRQTGRRTFLANDLQRGLSVVVKLLLFNPDFTWDDLKLFEREAEVLKSLDHPAIPKYLDYFEVETELGKGFALVQTYIEARSLQDWIQSGRTFNEEDLKAIAKELLGILDYLHNRQPPVVHRDIKPSNVLLGDRSGHSSGQVYLIDFGSVQTAVHGGTRTVVGTYGYMPPEQFGGYSTPTSDLYALGATLIYLATGQHPDQLPQREMRILFEDRVNLSPNLIDWLKWMTEPSTDLRLKSALQALEALLKSNYEKVA